MNPKIEVIVSKLSGTDLDGFRLKLKELHKPIRVINVSTTMDTQGLVIYATILYEDEPQIK
jgi:hypothetical protein